MTRYISIFFLFFSINTFASGNIVAFVSIPPQKYFVDRISGGEIPVQVMLAPGQRPETYEPSPRIITKLHEAQVYFRIGLPFETVLVDKLTAVNQQILITACCDFLQIIHGNEHKYEHLHADPHVWMDPVIVIRLAEQMKNVLVELNPQSATKYNENYDALSVELKALDSEIHTQLRDLRTPYVVISHDALGYYAQRYNLRQMAIESQGKERGPRSLADLIKLMQQQKINTIFMQRQYYTAGAQTLAQETGAALVEIDPLAENYIDNLRQITALIVKAGR